MKMVQYDEMTVLLTVSLDKKYIAFIYCGCLIELLESLDDFVIDIMEIKAILRKEINMITEQLKDENGNVRYEEHDDGYREYDQYDSDKLIRSEQHYPNGIVEVEHFARMRH
jgi:chaperonin GroEL (HSP60 family)